jgi:hypothetical protein
MLLRNLSTEAELGTDWLKMQISNLTFILIGCPMLVLYAET